MVHLYNHTRYDDAVIRAVLNFAARAVGVQGGVPVKITYCQKLRGTGTAYNGYPYLKTLKGRPTTSRDKRLLTCPHGWVEMHLPRTLPARWDDFDPPIEAAEWFVGVAIHEMAHILDYRSEIHQRQDYFGHRPGKRRMAHDSRPCEIFAENKVYDVEHNRAKERRRQDLVMDLAIAIDGAR